MNKDLDEKARVVVDLLNIGVDYVNITNTSLIAWRRPGYEIKGNPIGSTQIVNVHTYASASSSENIAIQFGILRQELKEIYKDDARLIDLEKRIKQIEIELIKKSPDKSKLKSLLTWILDFDWDMYLRVIAIILEKFS